jgi:hypothetical protein
MQYMYTKASYWAVLGHFISPHVIVDECVGIAWNPKQFHPLGGRRRYTSMVPLYRHHHKDGEEETYAETLGTL